MAKNGSDSNTGSIVSPFLTIGKPISLLPASSSTQYVITVFPGIYTENLVLSNLNTIIQGVGTQDSTNNTTIQGTHTINTSGISRFQNFIGFRNIQLLPIINAANPMISLSTVLSGKGALTFNNVKFGEASGSGINWISSGSTCDMDIRFYTCRLITASQLFTQSMLQFGGNSTVNIQNCYIEVDQSLSAVEMDNTSLLSITNTSIYNVNPASTVTNGLVYFNSTITSPHTMAVCSILSTNPTQNSGIFISLNGQNLIVQNCGISVASVVYAITGTGEGPATTVLYYGNTTLPGYSTTMGPIGINFLVTQLPLLVPF